MSLKNVLVVLLGVSGVYFLLFHADPFPFSHNAIGLPPYHAVHSVFGVLLLGFAWYFGKRK